MIFVKNEYIELICNESWKINSTKISIKNNEKIFIIKDPSPIEIWSKKPFLLLFIFDLLIRLSMKNNIVVPAKNELIAAKTIPYLGLRNE